MNKHTGSDEHPEGTPASADGGVADAAKEGLDRDEARRQQRDHMVTDTSATTASRRSSSGETSDPPAGDATTTASPDADTSERPARSSVESPANDSSGALDQHSGSERDTLGVGGRGQG
jgi:hypothetical protein